MCGAQKRFVWTVLTLLIVMSQVAIINAGCILQIKLPLGIWGYSPTDYSVLHFKVGDTVKFRCINQHQITYNLTGSPKIQCQWNNAWSAKPPRCKATLCSPSPPTVPNAMLFERVVPGKTNKIGKIVHYNCTTGFLSPGLIKVCEKDGYWRGIVNCSRIICPPPTLTYGKASYISLVYGSVAKYTCNLGYILSGPSTRLCDNHGQWSRTEPQCSKLCPKLENFSNGHYQPAQQTYRPGERIKFHCISDRYVVKGSATRTCLEDGSWSGYSTKCVINRCVPVGAFNDGTVFYSREPYIIGTTAKFQCHSGFKLMGDKMRKCQRNGMWSGLKNPKCTALHCGEPGVIINGKHFPQNANGIYSYGTTVKYSCKYQFYLWGNSTIKCESYDVNTYWTKASPECLTITQFSSKCHEIDGHFHIEHGQPKCIPKTTMPPHIADSGTSNRQLDTLTIVTASAGSTLGALVILLSIMVFVRRFQRNRRFNQTIRSRFYSDDDHVTLITLPRGYHFSLPSYDEAMSQVQRDPPPFDTVVQDNATTVINNNINITLPSDDNSIHRETSDSRTHGRTILQVSADQQINIVNNPMPGSTQGELDANSTANQVDNSSRNSVSSQESLQISEPPSLSMSEDEHSINESQPLIGSN